MAQKPGLPDHLGAHVGPDREADAGVRHRGTLRWRGQMLLRESGGTMHSAPAGGQTPLRHGHRVCARTPLSLILMMSVPF